MFISKLLIKLSRPFGLMYVAWQYMTPLVKVREISALAYYGLVKRNRILVVYTKNHARMNIVSNYSPDGLIYIRMTQKYKSGKFLEYLMSKVDAIYQDGPHPVSIESGKPLVLEYEHRYFEHDLVNDPRVKKIFVMSHFAKPNFDDPKNKIEVLYPAFPARNRNKVKGREQKNITIFMSGTDATRKGADILFSAFERVEEKLSVQYQLNLVMASNYKKHSSFYKVTDACLERTRAAYEKSKLKSNVIFSPIHPPLLVNYFYRNSDIYVMPTRYDSPGMSILEAMSFGLPIVSTNINAIPELVKHGYNGYLIDVKQYELRTEEYYDYAVRELEQYLTTLILDPELRQEMGANSLKIMSTSISMDYKVNRLSEIFKSIAAESA